MKHLSLRIHRAYTHFIIRIERDSTPILQSAPREHVIEFSRCQFAYETEQ